MNYHRLFYLLLASYVFSCISQLIFLLFFPSECRSQTLAICGRIKCITINAYSYSSELELRQKLFISRVQFIVLLVETVLLRHSLVVVALAIGADGLHEQQFKFY